MVAAGEPFLPPPADIGRQQSASRAFLEILSRPSRWPCLHVATYAGHSAKLEITTMTALSTPRFLAAAAAAVTGMLLFAHVPQAEAAGGAGVKTTTTGTNKPGPSPVVSSRDHRNQVIRDHRGQTRTRPPPRPICAGWAC